MAAACCLLSVIPAWGSDRDEPGRGEAGRGRFGTGPAYQALGDLPLLHRGRIKPLDTVARLELQEIYGRDQIKLLDAQGETIATWTALGALLNWPVRPAYWDEQEIILIDMWEYRTLKQQLLRAPIVSKLKTIAARTELPSELQAQLSKLIDAEIVTEADIERLLESSALSEAERGALGAWAGKLSEGRKWVAPADLENAILKRGDGSISFMDWVRELSERQQQARQSGKELEFSRIERQIGKVAERLFQYERFRDRNEGANPELDLAIVPRPVSQAYLDYTARILNPDLKPGDAAEMSALQTDASVALARYVREIESLGRYVSDVREGKRKPPGQDPDFDRGFTKWLRLSAAWVPLRIMLESDPTELEAAGFSRSQVEAFREAYVAFEAAEAAAPGQAAEAPAKALVAAARVIGEASNPEIYPTPAKMAEETHFNRFAPFARAPWAYGAGLVLLLISLGISAPASTKVGKFGQVLYALGMLAFVAGILLEIYGFTLRVRISGWAPVTNMYETVVWVAFGAAVLGLVLELIFRRKYAATAASGVALLGTVLAANVPLLDANIGSLTPVLRDNYWLTVHVLTIVSSYAAFSLALGLGLLSIGYYLTATYRRDVSFGELMRSWTWSVPMLVAGASASWWVWAQETSLKQASPFLFWSLAVVAGLAAVVGGVFAVGVLVAMLGEAANRRPGRAIAAALAVCAAAVAVTLTVWEKTPPAGWPQQLPLTFPSGTLALLAIGYAVSCGLGARSRRFLKESVLVSDVELNESRRMEPEHELVGAGASSARVRGTGIRRGADARRGARPPVSEILARAAGNTSPVDPRGQAIQYTVGHVKPLSNFLYRAMQVGVLLVAAGTILGGVWADVSWGRFWGWDPKEVWALITLLVYLIPLHGRFAGWVSTFGLVAASVVCYLAVLMAWYGVNFVLGVGLHSYGFTEGGGQGVVISVCLVVLSIVAGTYLRRKAGSQVAASVA